MYAKRKGFLIELFTNGSLITPQIVETLKKYPPLLIDISLYGSNDGTYENVTGERAFEKVIEACRQLKAAGIRIALKSPMLTLTVAEYSAMAALADDLRVPFRASFEIIPTIDKDITTRNYQVSAKEMLRCEFEDALSARPSGSEKGKTQNLNIADREHLFRCKVGRSSCIIDYNGKMCPCMKFKHIGKRLTFENFDELWESFGVYVEKRVSPKYKCLNCDAYDYCDICPAEMDFVYGDFEYIDDLYCKIARTRKLFHEGMHSIDEVLKDF